jgi:hypothetical protein
MLDNASGTTGPGRERGSRVDDNTVKYMGIDYSAVLVYGVKYDRNFLDDDKDADKAFYEWRDECDDMIVLNRTDHSTSYNGLECTGIPFVHVAEYIYDEPADIYVCAVFYHADDWSCMQVDIPAVTPEKQEEIDAWISAELIRRGITAGHDPPAWHLMTEAA